MLKKLMIIAAVLAVLIAAIIAMRLAAKPEIDAQVRARAKGSFADLSRGIVHYEVQGNPSAELVVLIHGATVPMEAWDHTIAPLVQNGYRTMRFDLYGRGFSDRPHNITYDSDLYVTQIREMIEHSDYAGRIHLIGVSLGGALAVSYADRYPHEIKSMTLIAPAGPYLSNAPLAERLGRMVNGISSLVMPKDSAARARARKLSPLKQRVKEQFKYKGTVYAGFSFMTNRDPQDLERAFRNLGRRDIPGLLIWGNQDRVLPYKYSAEVLKILPGFSFKAISRAGHAPQYEQPGQVNRAIVNFLKETGSLPAKNGSHKARSAKNLPKQHDLRS
ncbi:MAG: alpha/beta fold hydrolase [Chitinivibrionales bacterium]|nr:alpha/beta fold hydrolase [Chitinivibrionales bacterium]